MISLLSYIFTKSYWLCVNIFKEKEFPEYFASGIIAVLITGTVIFLVNSVLYIIDPSLINIIFGYYKYLSLGMVLLFWGYFGYLKKYIIFVNRFEKMSEAKKKIFKVLSVFYILIVIVAFFGMSNAMRAYNITNR